ncbi:ran GTPase-activating protein 1-like isoform X2 [Amphibalanus amphitrite]|uniref:ran GTPase-activating protein 1-like isoform X2 n=1 Tax=Amphibalanus amphitrite TaxID=1232801 RepID=UPI001C8FB2B1|nr:ran GTPase-activating protein 1-like isoform X2 [Amphibalanus amphitrite]XP_043219234.1 ran GTPase-activating protein 1-like isoform X2 [Amphibalanus amphitrite]XP_043219235.1 ran GTPase-activating protein 1-like isoform X2 [Amphibalanus amphitrite]
MADKLVEKLAGATLDTTATTLSFANRNLKLDSEEDAKEITDAIKNFKSLKSLVLEGNTLGIGAAKAIGKALESHPEVQEIHGKDLFTGRLKTEIPQALTHVGSGLMLAGARLTVLDLSDNAVGPVGMDGLHVLLTSPVCYTLQRLLLNNNGWGPTGGVRLADCLIECHERSVRDGTPMKLREFVSGRSRLENPGALRLAEFFKRVKTMEKVVMPQNGIYHEGVQALAEALSENPALQHLDLNDNLLTPKGARALAKSLPKMEELRVLNLNDCLLRAAGARAVAAAIRGNNPKLEELHLAFNEVTRAAAVDLVEAAAGRESLSLVHLDGNQLGEEGIEAVRDAAAAAGLADTLGGFSEDEDEPDSDEEQDEEEEEEEDGEGAESEGEHVSPMKREEAAAAKRPGITPIQCTVAEFLCQPTAARLLGLGDQRQQLLTKEALNVKEIGDGRCAAVQRHLQLLSAVCRVDASQPPVDQLLPPLVDALLRSALDTAGEDLGLLSNSLLVYLGLIKCEDKQFSVSWDVKGMLVALTRAVRQPYFPATVRDTLQTFLSRPNKTVDVHPQQKHLLMQALFQ